MAQNETSSTSAQATSKQTKRGPIFRATKEQINQAQALLKSRGFYSGEQLGKLDDATREGLRKYQQAEGLKVTGTLNKVTLEKMNIELTEKQKNM
jgi:peptidoglycan hydrolase-like protein with peptidoglycan-binding domain